MKFSKVVYAAASMMLPALAHATLITTVYDARLGSFPEAQGFTKDVTPPITPVLSSGVLDVDASGQPFSSLAYYSDINGTFLFSSFVMEATVQIVSSSQRGTPNGGNSPRAGFLFTADDDNVRNLQVEITDTGLWMDSSDGGGINPFATSFLNFDTTSAFHTYRVEANGSTASLYIDHGAAASLSLNVSSLQVDGPSTPDQVYFGDASVLARSHYRLQDFLFSSDLSAQVQAAPEPGTLALLLAAFGAVLGVRGSQSSRRV